jgi:DNA polymerase III epsilon subunit family exonuclease
VRCTELARRLLALSGAPSSRVARRLLAAALECPTDTVPERFGPGELQAARHGLLAPGEPARRTLDRQAFAVVDLETTGLSADTSAILEIGAVRIENLRIVERFSSLIDPGMAVPARIARLTGIDDALVEDAPGPDVVLPAFRRWLEATPEAAFVAHNASFDARFVRSALVEQGLEPLDAPVLCTLRLGRRLVPQLRRYDLDSLSAHFGISNKARHRALGDAESTARLLLDLLGLARLTGLETLSDLLDLQARPPERRRKRRPRRRAQAAVRADR